MRKMIEVYESTGLKLYGPVSLAQQFEGISSLPKDIYKGLFFPPDEVYGFDELRSNPKVAVARLVFCKESV